MAEGSKQIPATLSRGFGFPGWQGTKRQYRPRILSTPEMRIMAMSCPVLAACRATMKHQVLGLGWKLLDDQGAETDLRKPYEQLFDNANDGDGTFNAFLDRYITDILTAREGAFFEIVRDSKGRPVGLYNVDAVTIRYTGNSETPFVQKAPLGEQDVAFARGELAQALWHPKADTGQQHYSETPIQLSYGAIDALASADQFNLEALTQRIPLGILNLGAGFTLEEAQGWKKSWDGQMAAGMPSEIGFLYGTTDAAFINLTRPITEMAFENTSHWYASLIAACFEMSIMDISILTKVSTKAAATEQRTESKQQGLRNLVRLVQETFDLYVLPPGLHLVFEDIDPTDEAAEATTRQTNASTLKQLSDAGLPMEVLLGWATRVKLLTDQEAQDALKLLAAEKTKREEAKASLAAAFAPGLGGPVAPQEQVSASGENAPGGAQGGAPAAGQPAAPVQPTGGSVAKALRDLYWE